MSRELPIFLLEYLTNAKPEYKRTIDNIDLGLSQLIKDGESTAVIQFLEEYLVARGKEASILHFDSFETI